MANPNIPTLRSIEAMKREIESQLMLLDDLELVGQVDVSRCTMTGSGDSYVAASIAQLFVKLQNKMLLSFDFNF